MHICVHTRIHIYTCQQIQGEGERERERERVRQTDGRTDGRTDRQTDTDRQADRPTDPTASQTDGERARDREWQTVWGRGLGRMYERPCTLGTRETGLGHRAPLQEWTSRSMSEFPEIRGTLFWGPENEDPTIQGTIVGSSIFGNSHVTKQLI